MKRKKALIFFIIVFFTTTCVFSQKFILSGYLYDSSSGEGLIGANVFAENTNYGVVANAYGFYSLTLPKGNYTLHYSFVGFKTYTVNLNLNKNITKNIELQQETEQLEEVIIGGTGENKNITNTEVSAIKLDIKDTKTIPVFFGEQDVIKTMQLMPGVSSTSEGSSGFFVRGGDADQNLILLDEAPVYNASHLLGFFSVFNSDALKDVKLLKGGIPAKYGGKASSVLNVRMKDGNSKQWKATGGIGLISSGISVEGPLVKDKSSVMISGRRTYFDLIAKAISEEIEEEKLYFYDLNLKANYNLSDNDKIFVSGYFGRDVLGVEDFGFSWGNKTLTMRWNHIFTSNLFMNTSLIYSDYNYGFNVKEEGKKIDLISGIFDYNIKQDYTYYVNTNNKVSFGWNEIYHQFKPSVFIFGEAIKLKEVEQRKALESSFYVSNNQKITKNISAEYGLRLSTFSNLGAYTEKKYNKKGDVISKQKYKKGNFYNTYANLEPRINITYILNNTNSIKASYRANSYFFVQTDNELFIVFVFLAIMFYQKLIH